MKHPALETYDIFLVYLLENLKADISDFTVEAYKGNNSKKIAENVIMVEWNTGGASGGNCWDDSRPHHFSGDEEPEFESLNNIVLDLFPEIPHKLFIKVSSIIEKHEWTDYEYYGNYTERACKYVRIEKLYNFLKELSS